MTKNKSDPYISYIHRFFNIWAPIYDLFGFLILPVYQKIATIAGDISSKRILDVCTGTGAISLRLASKGAEVTAIDITPSMIERAKRKDKQGLVSFIEADARKLPFADKSFDISYISLGLHDMPRPVRIEVLHEMARVTRDRIVVAEYYFANHSFYQRMLKFIIKLFETSYFVRFSDEGTLPLLREAGFNTVTSYPIKLSCFCIYIVELN